jgi:hypothetical protein
MSLQPTNVEVGKKYDRLRTAMVSHTKFAKQLLAFPDTPPDFKAQALQVSLITLRGIITTLQTE